MWGLLNDLKIYIHFFFNFRDKFILEELYLKFTNRRGWKHNKKRIMLHATNEEKNKLLSDEALYVFLCVFR